ncbi:putative ferric-chelate reductase 1 homolog [Schistocerca americana]|uniref:putative ferric-chelate reductase 1 homolog n=1 Tax=Schistocerca americana TaxID=7009 RepID=UPI001F4F1409|nr:putative ferric-chelate reductase 1 homolog [Schistocerca americana]
MREWTAWLLLWLCLCGRGWALSSGAPNGTCASMTPRHTGSTPQSSPPPYTVTPSVRQVARNGKLTVALASPQGLPIHGFLLEARAPGSDEAQGAFTSYPDTAKTINCNGRYASAVTHKDASKKNSLTFEWTAPDEDIKMFVFRATVVQDFQTYWTGILSEEVKVVEHPEVTTDHSTGISTTRNPVKSTTEIPVIPEFPDPKAISEPSNPIYEGCGSTKACFGPGECLATKSCSMMVSVLDRVEDYEFEMMADSALYVAVGLSDDGIMGDDSVVECVYDATNTAVQAYRSSNAPDDKANFRDGKPFEGITLVNHSYVNGRVYCRFRRQVVTYTNNKTYDLANQPFFLLLASGTSLKDNNIGIHSAKVSTSSAKYLSDVTGWTAASKVLLRLHGAFMIAAWIGTASLGILLARYFRQTWVGTQLCKKDLWFAWHRMLMVTTWVLTIAGFVIIFVELRGWSQEDNPHAILGTITTILAFIQPIGAAFRPHPGTRQRPIFNWVHWFIGNSAHILAIVTIFFAAKLGKAELPVWLDWILVSYVVFHVVMHLVFSVTGCMSERHSASRIDSFPMKDIASSRMALQTDRKHDAPFTCLRKVLLGIYIVIILGLAVAIIVIVALAPIEESYETFSRWLKDA